MKTISDFNKKSWYRLLKVIYVLIFIPILIYPPLIIYDIHKPKIDDVESYILCDDGRKITLNEIGVSLIDNDSINEICTGSSIPSIKQVLEGKNNYELNLFYTERNWGNIIVFSLLSIILIIFAFELIKRIFYYIILGSFKPQK